MGARGRAGLWLALVGVAVMSACVIPQAIEIQDDNTPPRIDLSNTNPERGTIGDPGTDVKQSAGQPRDTTSFTVAVNDPDDEDIAMRLFVDGDYATFWAENTVGPTERQPRLGLMQVDGLCDEVVQFELGRHSVEVWVSDAGFVSSGPFLNLPAVTDDGRLGGRDSVTWMVECVFPGQPPGDGGI